ncbi:MAG: NAD(P)-dependent oxidoreductase [Microbacterium sp.]|nr:NAD(P)-dependent oxidoreductase [Microbacterium sp.]
MTRTTTIAVLGLGEAGTIYARGLAAAGARVRGYDPFASRSLDGIDRIDDLARAVDGADAVLSLVGGASALAVAAPALAALRPEAVYADFNTAGPDVKRGVAALATARGIPMADVAVLAPVPRAGHRTGVLASGDGARPLAELLEPLGVPVETIDAAAGEAARLRLLRSGFMKGLAGLVIEGLGAARTTGDEEWLRRQMAAELGPGGADLIDRLLDGTHRHAARRAFEMRAVVAAAEASGQPADLARETLAWLERIAGERSG